MIEGHSFPGDEAVKRLLNRLTTLREKYIEIETLETQLRQIEIEIRSLSIHDELTGVFNIRGFISLTGQQIKLADRTKVGILILYAVVDNRSETDRAMIETAGILKSIYRDSDIVSRVSDDEFMVVLISATDGNSKLISDRFRNAIEGHNMSGISDFKLSIRFCTIYYDPDQPCSIDELLETAGRMRPGLRKI